MSTRGRYKRPRKKDITSAVSEASMRDESGAGFSFAWDSSDWRVLQQLEEAELVVGEVLETWLQRTIQLWFDRYLHRLSPDYVWLWYRQSLIRAIYVATQQPDPGDVDEENESWRPDPEPKHTPLPSCTATPLPITSATELGRRIFVWGWGIRQFGQRRHDLGH